jgi:type I restriction enzyme S subunit
LPIALPPLEEQARIVAELERQFSFVDACERAVDAGLARSAALRRSVLKAAFEGRLVPQDPSDEPASVLLERIRAERAAAPGQQGKRRKKAEAS